VPLLLPLVLLATVATVIASQAVITGSFSMTRQAIQLGLLPRLQVIQTSAAGYGQIYLPSVNWLLMVVTLALAVSFKNSGSLAAAYGIAVSATMLATTVLLSIAMREVWSWPLPAVIVIGLGFATVDGGFLAANSMKIAQGGWVPLMLGVLICSVMLVWRMGNAAVQKQADEMQIPIGNILAQIASGDIPRVRGTAVFVARLSRDVPPIVVWHLRHIRALHGSIVIVNVVTELVPYVASEKRVEVREIRDFNGSFPDFVARGAKELLSTRWTRDSFADLLLPFAIRLILASLFWLWPNRVYWKKRAALFS
jgi:KUP system potassium uptake protein